MSRHTTDHFHPREQDRPPREHTDEFFFDSVPSADVGVRKALITAEQSDEPQAPEATSEVQQALITAEQNDEPQASEATSEVQQALITAEQNDEPQAPEATSEVEQALIPAEQSDEPQAPEATSVVQLGYVDFDGSACSNVSCGVIVPADCAKHFRRDIYVGIRDREQGLEFLGRIVAGPFHTPQEQHPKSATAQETVLDPDRRQGYHVRGKIEILGQLTEGERVVASPTRPRPYSEIYLFPDHRLQQFLGIKGDFYLGHLYGHPCVKVHAQSTNKDFLPRNVGVFGTVGSGKSNTAQVLAEEAIEAGWAVVLIDVEGEYVCMNEPLSDPKLAGLLESAHQLQPKGIEDFRVYVPSSGSSAATSPLPFKVPISAFYPEVVADILEFTEAQARVFAMVTAQAERLYSTEDSSPDELQRPYNLQQLLDGLMVSPTANGPSVRLLPMANEQDVSTAGVLRSKLLHLGRSGMLDWKPTAPVPELPIDELLVGGRLSVLDISETDDRSRNLAIAYVLQELFKQVIQTPMASLMPSGEPRPPLLVMIEEVHTFVSRAAAPKMRAVLDSLQIISRRGRKRWMSLALVSQQPNHVPDEIFELANTRFIHQVKSPKNLDPIKRTTAGIDEALWANVPAMGPGQSLLTGAAFKKSLFVKIRPARSRRLLAS